MRIPVSPREKTAYIRLRAKGYTISTLSKAFGRSTSQIHKILKNATWIMSTLKLKDLRKIPRRIRELHASWSPRILQHYLAGWEQWISSEEGDPP